MGDHGTYAGFQRHRKARESPCDPCRLARNEYYAEYRRRRAANGGGRLGGAAVFGRRARSIDGGAQEQAPPQKPARAPLSSFYTGFDHESAPIVAVTAKEWCLIHGYNPETRTYERN